MPIEASPARDKPLKFSGDNAFHCELRSLVNPASLRSGNRQRDSAAMYFKAAIILSVFAVTYVTLVFFAGNG